MNYGKIDMFNPQYCDTHGLVERPTHITNGMMKFQKGITVFSCVENAIKTLSTTSNQLKSGST